MHFAKTKTLAPLTLRQLFEIAERFAPGARIEIGRGEQMPVVAAEMTAFLKRTEVDRNTWREAQQQTDTAEMVCTSFSLLLWALLEQERLRVNAPYPLAVARVSLVIESTNEEEFSRAHSMNAFINESGTLLLIEPQTDVISLPPKNWRINSVHFQ